MNKTTTQATMAGTILAIAIIALIVFIYRPTGDHAASAPPTSIHPGFPLPDLQGRMIRPEDYHGKVILVNFWATWCGPCRFEIPDFRELYKQYHSQGLEILGVALDEQGTPVVKPFVGEVKINYPVLIGNEKIAMAYEIDGIPTTLVLDRQGKLQKRLVGMQSRASLEALIKSLL